jgi:hypothetical protein
MESPPVESPIDPQLQALLDEALAPDQVPADLAERVARQTSPQLLRSSVAGRLFVAMRAAAAIALVATVTAAFWSVSHRPVDVPGLMVRADEIQMLAQDLAEWDVVTDQSESDPLDDQIAMVAMQVDLLQQLETAIDGGQELVDQAVTNQQLDELVGQMQLFF